MSDISDIDVSMFRRRNDELLYELLQSQNRMLLELKCCIDTIREENAGLRDKFSDGLIEWARSHRAREIERKAFMNKIVQSVVGSVIIGVIGWLATIGGYAIASLFRK